MKTRHLICLSVVVSLLCAVPAAADNFFWIGDVGDDATNVNNWVNTGSSSVWTWNDGGAVATTLPTIVDTIRIDWRLDDLLNPPAANSPVIKAGDTLSCLNGVVGRGFYHPGFGQLDVYGTLYSPTGNGDFHLGQHGDGTSQVSEGIVNVYTGGLVEVSRLYMARRANSNSTLNIFEGGVVKVVDRELRFGGSTAGGQGVINVWGELVTNDLRMYYTAVEDYRVNIGAKGVLMLTGGEGALGRITAYIGQGRVQAIDENYEVVFGYDEVAGVTTVWVVEDILKRSPKNRQVVDLNVFNKLEWTLPDPNDPVTPSVVSVDVYLGTDPNEQLANLGLTKIVDNQSVEFVDVSSLVVADTVYYWFIDVYDTDIDGGATPYFKSTVWSFDTSGIPPVVDAGQDIQTWVVDGSRVVQLDGYVDSFSSYTSTWTVFDEPDPTGNPAQISNPAILNPTVTLTAVGVYTLELEADDGNFQVPDTMQIIVYADACEHASNQPGFVWNPADITQDCKVNLDDLAALASQWLVDYQSTE